MSEIHPMRRVQKVEIQRPGMAGSLTPADKAELKGDINGMPTVIAGSYTKRLSNYGGNLAAAIADLPDSGASGGDIRVDGEVPFGSMLTLPPGINLIGDGPGSTRLIFPEAYADHGLVLHNPVNQTLADFSLTMEESTPGGNMKFGILAYGDGENLLLDNVHVSKFGANIKINGRWVIETGDVTGAGVLRDVSLVNCRGDWSTYSYGIEVSGVDGATVNDCHAHHNFDDGLKLSVQTKNAKVVSGTYNYNGEGGSGDGIDAFAGGDTFVILGATCDNNATAGCVIKSDSMQVPVTDGGRGPGYDVMGFTRNIQVTNLVARNNQSQYGLGVFTASDPGYDVFQIADAVITGGYFEGNATHGLVASGRNIVISSPLAKRNGHNGIHLWGGYDIEVNSPICVANSQAGAGLHHGLRVTGVSKFRVNGGIYEGADDPTVKTESDLNAATKWHQHSIYIDASSSDGDISYPNMRRQASSTAVYMVSGSTVRVNTVGTGVPLSVSPPGGRGSRYTNHDTAAPSDVEWVKRQGFNGAAAQGWERIHQPPAVTSIPSAGAFRVGDMLRLSHGGSSEDELYICVQTGASTFAWRKVELS